MFAGELCLTQHFMCAMSLSSYDIHHAAERQQFPLENNRKSDSGGAEIAVKSFFKCFYNILLAEMK